eukprot:TRINITY_DN9036_c0_g4_i3.p1 TRINITY_DN9036_c0_g4~~TRINITY_DN9036_c0_g4_i3.p1  ORF type:complete len:548 (+),score=175.00 TRINITY_DN9036_c0_g4_i3:41-1645(+)
MVKGRPESRTGLVWDERMQLHRNVSDPHHIDSAMKTGVTVAQLQATGLLNACRHVPARRATDEELLACHTQEHVDRLDATIRSPATMSTDGDDVYASPFTAEAVRLSAGGLADLAVSVSTGELHNGFAVLRPPGHHCSAMMPSGFCLVNNVAVAARAAQRALRAELPDDAPEPRIMVLDWDVHHGNGTEWIFYDDPSVLVVSVHGHGTGRPHHVSRALQSDVRVQDAKTEVEVRERYRRLQLENGLPDPYARKKKRRQRGRQPASSPAAAEPKAEGTSDGDTPAKRRKIIVIDSSSEEGGEPPAAAATAAAAAVGVAVAGAEPCEPPAEDGDGSSSEVVIVRAVPSATDPEDDEEEEESTTSSEIEDAGFYPATGDPLRAGVGRGAGFNVNIAWPCKDFGDLEYLRVIDEVVMPLGESFAPQLVMVSAGFDCALFDKLGEQRVTPSGFAKMTQRLGGLAGGKLVVALEGGYTPPVVALSAETVVRELLRQSGERLPATAPLPQTQDFQCTQTIRTVKDALKDYWPSVFGDAGVN